jgi:hypothetical protein
MLGIAESVIGVAGKVLDKFVGDKDLKVKLEAELNKEQTSLYLCQWSKTSYYVGMLLCSGMAVYSCTHSVLGYCHLVSYGNTPYVRD